MSLDRITSICSLAALLFLSACRGDVPRAAAPEDSAAVDSASAPAVQWLVTQRVGAVAMDTARIITAGPLYSTAGWKSWQVAYETNLNLEDSVELAAQADSLFEHLLPEVAQRADTTAFLEAHVRAGAHSGTRFLYHKLPDGTWERVN
jgi:hypothetical protein